ncbi:MAG TPA: hypothetical protein P5229_04945 [Candidatus Gracilibacteria bacterium]|nr:hypothetical protein [Candidatus Gracilibacteria bacterium]
MGNFGMEKSPVNTGNRQHRKKQDAQSFSVQFPIQQILFFAVINKRFQYISIIMVNQVNGFAPFLFNATQLIQYHQAKAVMLFKEGKMEINNLFQLLSDTGIELDNAVNFIR